VAQAGARRISGTRQPGCPAGAGVLILTCVWSWLVLHSQEDVMAENLPPPHPLAPADVAARRGSRPVVHLGGSTTWRGRF
jgi:hypothetical protein